jgi:hypothetical protein
LVSWPPWPPFSSPLGWLPNEAAAARIAVRVLPEGFRDRYEGELLALLDDSPAPLGDTLDVLRLAAKQRSELLVPHRLHSLALAALAASLVVFGYALNDLRSGLAELPQHWWSSTAVVALVASALTAFVSRPHGAPTNNS